MTNYHYVYSSNIPIGMWASLGVAGTPFWQFIRLMENRLGNNLHSPASVDAMAAGYEGENDAYLDRVLGRNRLGGWGVSAVNNSYLNKILTLIPSVLLLVVSLRFMLKIGYSEVEFYVSIFSILHIVIFFIFKRVAEVASAFFWFILGGALFFGIAMPPPPDGGSMFYLSPPWGAVIGGGVFVLFSFFASLILRGVK